MKRSNETKIGQQSEQDHGREHSAARKREHNGPENKSGARQGEPPQGTRALSSEPQSGQRKKYDQHLCIAIRLANGSRSAKLDAGCRARGTLWVKIRGISPGDSSSPSDGIEIEFRAQHRQSSIIARLRVGNVLKHGESAHKTSGKQQSPGGPP